MVGCAAGGGVGVRGAGAASRATARGVCSLPDDDTTRLGASGFAGGAACTGGSAAGGSGTTGGATGSGFSAGTSSAFAAFVGFLAAGCSSRIRPSRSAFRRTRSACASSTLEEWLLAPIPSASHRLRVSLLVSPSSLASSWMRILEAKWFFSPSSFCRGFQCAWLRFGQLCAPETQNYPHNRRTSLARWVLIGRTRTAKMPNRFCSSGGFGVW